MKRTIPSLPWIFPLLFILSTIHCDWFDLDDFIEQDPTKTRMEGVWEVTEAYNEDGESILENISFPITAFHLSNDNSVTSTAGPMISLLVFGQNDYTRVASQIDQFFNYSSPGCRSAKSSFFHRLSKFIKGSYCPPECS